ncbi:MAG: KH domain-containing protein [Clostridia bacterium]
MINYGEYMLKSVNNTINETDLVVFLVDINNVIIDDLSKEILKNIVKLNRKVILCISKIDSNKKEEILRITKEYTDYISTLNYSFIDIIPISTKDNINLDLLIKTIENNLPICDKIYEDDDLTDITEKDIVEEIIREKLLKKLENEVPHNLNVEVTSFKERTNINNELTYDICADIICDKKSHKPIILGEDGKLIRHITNISKIDIIKSLEAKVNLKLWVKVREDLRNRYIFLKNVKNKI